MTSKSHTKTRNRMRTPRPLCESTLTTCIYQKRNRQNEITRRPMRVKRMRLLIKSSLADVTVRLMAVICLFPKRLIRFWWLTSLDKTSTFKAWPSSPSISGHLLKKNRHQTHKLRQLFHSPLLREAFTPFLLLFKKINENAGRFPSTTISVAGNEDLSALIHRHHLIRKRKEMEITKSTSTLWRQSLFITTELRNKRPPFHIKKKGKNYLQIAAAACKVAWLL